MTRMPARRIRNAAVFAAVASLLLAALVGACTSQDPPAAEARTAAPSSSRSTPSGDWVTYNGPLSGDRFSPLAQITTANVGGLKQVCAFDAPEAVNFQSGIVAVGGVLYFTLFNH